MGFAPNGNVCSVSRICRRMLPSGLNRQDRRASQNAARNGSRLDKSRRGGGTNRNAELGARHNVRFGSKADIGLSPAYVCFTPESGHLERAKGVKSSR